ncbi:DUF4304 domain-containing protein [Dactylosporangium sp. NPDC049525]|uniref:DUF4304 domain-containing protein n=1 Tax=Dactylosporangium sp. NPDC049525 TaxID=3154730 RepID=UPI00343FA3AD
MDRSAKAVISDLLARDVTPLLKRHGFAGRGRNYRRTLADRQELLTVEPHRWNTRHGGAFTITLGVFLTGLDAFVSPAPPAAPPEEHECHLRRGIGDTDPGQHWWTFDAATDLPALGAEVRHAVQEHALGAFERLRTDAGVLAWVRGAPLPHGDLGLRHVYLAAGAGAPDLAQRWLDEIVAAADPGPGPLPREAARFAARLGLTCPPPSDAPTLTAVFRGAADSPPHAADDAVLHLVYKLDQHLTELRRDRPDAGRLYHTVTRDGLTCTADFYGAGAEELLRPLRRAFAKLSGEFAEITWQAR